MLTDLVTVLGPETRARFAYNLTSVEGFRALVAWGEAHDRPMVLQCSERYLNDLGEAFFRHVVIPRLDRSPVPFVLHLDHATSHPLILRAVSIGFSSVMFDGSLRPLAENIRDSGIASQLARLAGVSFEAEIGHVGGAEDGDEDDDERMTTVEEAVRFRDAVDVDFLAVAVGNAHGLYRRPPHIRLDRVAAIHEATGLPLVLHGGTGIPREDLVDASRRGIRKINIGTELKRAWLGGMREAIAAGVTEPDQARSRAEAAVSAAVDELERIWAS